MATPSLLQPSGAFRTGSRFSNPLPTEVMPGGMLGTLGKYLRPHSGRKPEGTPGPFPPAPEVYGSRPKSGRKPRPCPRS